MKYIVEFEDEPCMYEDDVHFYKCIQAPWWGLSEKVIKQLTPYQPEPDCVSRKTALDAFGLSEKTRKYGGDHSGYDTRMLYEIQDTLENLPAVQPDHTADTGRKVEQTGETAQNVQNEDLIQRKMAIEALARMMPRSCTPDGSHPADEEIFRAQEVFADCIEALEILPSAQPEILACGEGELNVPDTNVGDMISRQAAIECVSYDVEHTIECLKTLPSAQPEIIRCKDCKHRHVENTVWTCPFGLPGGENFFCGYGTEPYKGE